MNTTAALHRTHTRWELPVLLILSWLVFVSVPLSLGRLGLSWDALNHHIYLGWTAERPRFDLDWIAASYQAYQYPYLYWPAYKLATTGFDGVHAGVLLATLHLIIVPPIWMTARACIPGPGIFEVCMRALGVLLAFMTAVVLKTFEGTSNDMLAAAPLAWAFAIALQPAPVRSAASAGRRMVLLTGCLAGASVAFKLSNGPLAVLLVALWAIHAGSLRELFIRLVIGSLAAGACFIALYGFWGWQLWRHFGNPIYPFADPLFEPLRRWLEWRP